MRLRFPSNYSTFYDGAGNEHTPMPDGTVIVYNADTIAEMIKAGFTRLTSDLETAFQNRTGVVKLVHHESGEPIGQHSAPHLHELTAGGNKLAYAGQDYEVQDVNEDEQTISVKPVLDDAVYLKIEGTQPALEGTQPSWPEVEQATHRPHAERGGPTVLGAYPGQNVADGRTAGNPQITVPGKNQGGVAQLGPQTGQGPYPTPGAVPGPWEEDGYFARVPGPVEVGDTHSINGTVYEVVSVDENNDTGKLRHTALVRVAGSQAPNEGELNDATTRTDADAAAEAARKAALERGATKEQADVEANDAADEVYTKARAERRNAKAASRGDRGDKIKKRSQPNG